MELIIPTSWHAGPHALSQDLVNYFPRGIWILITSYGVEELIHALSDDMILALWIKRLGLRVISDEKSCMMRARAKYLHNPFGGPAHIQIYANGDREETWYNMGMCHRVDGPARIRIYISGDREEIWYNMGMCHRVGGPAHARICSNGTRTEGWYQNGQRHRIGGPAHTRISSDDSTETWYQNGKRHRIGGPAYIYVYPNGRRLEIWYEDDKRHRIDGPAHIMIHPSGRRDEKWYENDIEIPH